MVSIRSDDIRGRWGHLIDNEASFNSIAVSGIVSGSLGVFTSGVVFNIASGDTIILQSGLTSPQLSGISLNIQSGIVVGTAIISGVTIFHGQITIGAGASGITFSGLQMFPAPTHLHYIIWGSGSTVYALNTQTGLIDISGTDIGSVISGATVLLTSGRTWKESIAIKGRHFVASGRPILVPSYTRLDFTEASINGSGLSAPPGGYPRIISNVTMTATSGSKDQEIEIVGGEWSCKSGGMAGGTITFSTPMNLTLCDMYTHHLPIGVNLQGIQGGVIESNRFEFSDSNGLRVAVDPTRNVSTTDLRIVHNKFDLNTVDGLFLGADVSSRSIRNVVVADNTARGNQFGFYISQFLRNVTISTNSADDNGDGGVSVGANFSFNGQNDGGPKYTERDIVCVGNTSRKGQDFGFYFTLIDGLNFVGNVSTENKFDGVHLDACRNVDIGNNLITNNSRAQLGAYVGIAVKSTTITALSGNTDISGTASFNINIHNNRIYDTDPDSSGIFQQFAVRVTGFTYNISIINNDVRNNRSGVSFSGSYNVSGNIIFNNIGFPTESQGVFIGSGNNSTTSYFIPHGLVVTPVSGVMVVMPASPQARGANTSGTFDISGNNSGIIVTYPTAPTSGDVRLYWRAQVQASML